MLQTRKNILDKARTELADSVNRSNQIYTNEELSTIVDEITGKFLDKTYPVGSIYISYSSTNPGSLFGGTWVSYGSGRTLVGVNTAESEFNTVGKTGGAKTHTNELGFNGAAMIRNQGNTIYFSDGYTGGTFESPQGNVWSWTHTPDISTTARINGIPLYGRTESGSSLQPYITVYMWRRTA